MDINAIAIEIFNNGDDECDWITLAIVARKKHNLSDADYVSLSERLVELDEEFPIGDAS